MTLGKAEISSIANLAVVTSSHGFELHGVDEFRHVHNQYGIDKVFIPVINIAYGLHRDDHKCDPRGPKQTLPSHCLQRRWPACPTSFCSRSRTPLIYWSCVHFATVTILDRALLLPVVIGQSLVARPDVTPVVRPSFAYQPFPGSRIEQSGTRAVRDPRWRHNVIGIGLLGRRTSCWTQRELELFSTSLINAQSIIRFPEIALPDVAITSPIVPSIVLSMLRFCSNLSRLSWLRFRMRSCSYIELKPLDSCLVMLPCVTVSL